MKAIAFLLLLSAVHLFGASDRPREPAQYPLFYVLRLPSVEALRDVWIRRVTVTIVNSVGYYLTAVPSDWLASATTKDGVSRIDFRVWPVAPGEVIKTHRGIGSLDKVVLVDPLAGSDDRPIKPEISVTVEFFKSGVGVSSVEISNAKVELRRWPEDGIARK